METKISSNTNKEKFSKVIEKNLISKKINRNSHNSKNIPDKKKLLKQLEFYFSDANLILLINFYLI